MAHDNSSPTGASTASLKANLLANFLGQGWAALMALVFVPVYWARLGPEGYGLVGIFTLLQAWLSLLDLSIGQTLSREVARAQAGPQPSGPLWSLLRSCELLCLAIAMASACLLVGSADWLAREWVRADALTHEDIVQAFSVMALVIALRILESLYRGAIVGSQRHRALNLASALLATARWGGAAITLTWIQADASAFFAWQGLVSLAAVAVYGRMLYRILPAPGARPAFSWQALQAVARFSGGMLATGVLALVLTQMDKLLLSRLLSLEAFGRYSIAVLAANALYQIVGPVTQTYAPRLAGLVARDGTPGLQSTYHQGAQMLAVALMPASLVLATFAEPVLALWTQDKGLAHQIAPVLRLLALGTLLNGLMGMPHMLQLAHGWPGLAVRINLVAAAAWVPMLLWVAPRHGGMGAAALWLAMNICTVLAGVHLMHQRLLPGGQLRWYWSDTLQPGLAAAAVVLVSAGFFPAAISPWASAAWIGCTGLLACLAAGWASASARARIKTMFQAAH